MTSSPTRGAISRTIRRHLYASAAPSSRKHRVHATPRGGIQTRFAQCNTDRAERHGTDARARTNRARTTATAARPATRRQRNGNQRTTRMLPARRAATSALPDPARRLVTPALRQHDAPASRQRPAAHAAKRHADVGHGEGQTTRSHGADSTHASRPTSSHTDGAGAGRTGSAKRHD